MNSMFTWHHQILKSKTKEPLKFLSSLGIRGTKFISVYNFPAQYPLFGNQRILNFWVLAVRDKAKIVLVEKYTLISWLLTILGVLGKVLV